MRCAITVDRRNSVKPQPRRPRFGSCHNRRHARTDFMWNPQAHAKPLGYLTALVLAVVLSGAQLATPALAQQGRPAAQQHDDPPRGNAAPAGEAGARTTRPQNKNALRLPADSTTD